MKKNIIFGIIISLLALSGLSINAMKKSETTLSFQKKYVPKIAEIIKKNHPKTHFCEKLSDVDVYTRQHFSYPKGNATLNEKNQEYNKIYNLYFANNVKLPTDELTNMFGKKCFCGKDLIKIKKEVTPELREQIEKETEEKKIIGLTGETILKIQNLTKEKISTNNLDTILLNYKISIIENMREKITNEVKAELWKKLGF